MSSINLRSRSYLLRLWREWRDGRWIQRASLEDGRTGERVGFADVEALCHHLRLAATSLSGTDSVVKEMGECEGR